MPLGRANTTTRARTPTTTYPQSPRPPTFLPPSHYAAAAGFKYPPDRNVRSEIIDDEGLTIERTQSAFRDPMPKALETTRTPLQSTKKVNDNRRFTLMSSRSKSDIGERNKRDSQLVNLPDIESQLLPSLRDTIDRMTRPPSRPSPSLPTTPSSLHVKSPITPLHSPSPATPSRSPRPRMPMTPKSSTSYTPLDESVTPKSKLTPKPALKSALKTPTPRLGAATPETPSQSLSPATSAVGALRSVRSLLRRKSSSSSQVDSKPALKPSESNIPRPGRLRSRTDPGTFNDPKVVYTPNLLSTPQPARTRLFVSSIPRPGAFSNRGDVSTDESDLESRYNSSVRDRRRLVVANAEVFASSSSSSENELDPLPVGDRLRGLGFAYSPNVINSHEPHDIAVLEPFDDDKRSSAVSCASSLSDYNDDGEEQQEEFDSADERKIRRRTALLDIVDGLNMSGLGRQKESDDESDYSGVDGLAISESAELRRQSEIEASESEYDDDAENFHRRGGGLPTVYVFPEEDQERHSPELHPYSHTRSSPSRSQSPFRASPQPPSEHGTPKSHVRHQGLMTPRDCSRPYDAIPFPNSSQSAAARERRAFGIPPSESDLFRPARGTREILSHADSVLSEIGEIWEEESDALSEGAEKLFKSLEGGRGHLKELNRTSVGRATIDSTPKQKARPTEPTRLDERTVRERGQGAEPRHKNTPWRCSIRESDYSALLSEYGEVETARQEVVWKLRESEAAFVQRMTLVVRLFILPLRVQDSKTWVSGVPQVIAKVFDWLEDILNLHTQMLETLQRLYANGYPALIRCGEALRIYPARMEVYQPYLVRLAESVESVKAFVEDEESDFGEFIRMQEASDECVDIRLTLERMLVEPVNRLAMYPGIFTRLLNATPKTHADYGSALCILHSTDLMIKVMTEVKLREDEYDLVKSVVEKIRGLPDIAARDRRLLHQGQVFDVTKHGEHGRAKDRSSRLFSAIQDWDVRRRSGSVGSASTAGSMSSWEMPSTPTPTHPTKFPRALTFGSSATGREESAPIEGSTFDVFVFSDVLVFAQPLNHRDSTEWTLAKDLGVVRLLDFKHECDTDVTLELLPVIDMDLNRLGPLSLDCSAMSLDIRLPGTEEDVAHWLEAFRRTAKQTAILISTPLGLDCDDKRQERDFVDSLLNSGLPIPKSPSVQFDGSAKQQEREERGWWSLRFREVLREMLARG